MDPPPAPSPGPTSSQLEGRAEHIQRADEEIEKSEHQWQLEKGQASPAQLLDQPGLWRWDSCEQSSQTAGALTAGALPPPHPGPPGFCSSSRASLADKGSWSSRTSPKGQLCSVRATGPRLGKA